MSEPIIQVENLGKRYQIQHQSGEKYATLRDTLARRLKNTLGRRKEDSPAAEDFWALKNVSFEVQPGEVVGMIGRNGAGKSTLLKILSRITEPTTGRITLGGRVASLLEVGTGFHPELTGRENIFLNGAILGMTKAEIRRKFDEIVTFAEVEKFLDTPVKRYSSGMYVRLAFAVAAHLDPEILIVDEVLAVGDSQFQAKCLQRMGEVAQGGRTVLFVSHNMAAVQNLCTHAILLNEGTIVQQGDTPSVVAAYLAAGQRAIDGKIHLNPHASRASSKVPWLQQMTLIDSEGRPASRIGASQSLSIAIEIIPPYPVRNPRVAIAIEDSHGRRLGTSASNFEHAVTGVFDSPFVSTVTFPSLGLGPGSYLLSVSIRDEGQLLDSLDGAAWFDVEWDNVYTTDEPYHSVYGPVLFKGHWSFENAKAEVAQTTA